MFAVRFLEFIMLKLVSFPYFIGLCLLFQIFNFCLLFINYTPFARTNGVFFCLKLLFVLFIYSSLYWFIIAPTTAKNPKTTKVC